MNTTTTTTNNNINSASSVLRRRSFKSVVAAGAIILVTVTGCTSAQRQALGEQDVRDALASQLKSTISDLSLSLGDSLVCTADIDARLTLSASCAATTTTGQAVNATFTGSADVDAETCTAELAVLIGTVKAVDQTDVKCFDSV
jgi:hypothetical protein